jgi:membrane-bound lytic murein transglycosylase B
VRLPRGFDFARAWSLEEAPISTWVGMGVARPSGRDFPRPTDLARLYMPAGSDGPVFLLLPNFAVLKRYNSSDSYALAVGHLADRIAGGGGFSASWPANDRPLNAGQRKELQALLNSKGYDVGEPDGVLGPKTRSAIMAYQSARGVAADGYASSRLLLGLR